MPSFYTNDKNACYRLIWTNRKHLFILFTVYQHNVTTRYDTSWFPVQFGLSPSALSYHSCWVFAQLNFITKLHHTNGNSNQGVAHCKLCLRKYWIPILQMHILYYHMINILRHLFESPIFGPILDIHMSILCETWLIRLSDGHSRCWKIGFVDAWVRILVSSEEDNLNPFD